MKHATNDRMTRLLTEEWNLLHEHEKRAALHLCRRWGREDAASGSEPPFGWTNRPAVLIRERLGEKVYWRWEAGVNADSLVVGGDGLDPREVMFSAIATETRLRARSNAARPLLREVGARTVNTRSRCALATA
jgi:hypothetical protein